MSTNVCTGDYYLVQWAVWIRKNNSLNGIIQKYQSCAEIIYRLNVAQSNVSIDFNEKENALYEKVNKAIKMLLERNKLMYDVIVYYYCGSMSTKEIAEKIKRGETFVKSTKKEAASWLDGYLSHSDF
jgi:DNA-directed RNA polymerase specialized sigma subunit